MLKKTLIGWTLVTLFVVGSIKEAQAQSSGLLLGIYYTKAQERGLFVQNTIDGYSADGQILKGDILVRIADERHRVFSINSGRDLEDTKARIGRNSPADVEVLRSYRDGSRETLYFRVVFQPVGGLPASARPRGVTGNAAVATISQSDGSFFEQGDDSGASGSFFRGR